MPAAAPPSFKLARSQLLSEAFRDQRLKVGDQRLVADAIVPLVSQQGEANESPEGIDQGHDFGGQPRQVSDLRPDFEPPFCSGAMLVDPTTVPSIMTYSKSGSSQRALKTPARIRRRRLSPVPVDSETVRPVAHRHDLTQQLIVRSSELLRKMQKNGP
nr:hypothetical protein [Bradyrhizobium sp. WSM3983]